MNAPLSLLGLILKSRVISRPTRYFAPRGDCFPAADSIDPSEAGISLAGRGAGYKTRLHRHQCTGHSGQARTLAPHCPGHWSLSRWSPLSWPCSSLPGPGVCLTPQSSLRFVAGFLPPCFSPVAARCWTLHVVLTLCMATTGQPPADAIPSRMSDRDEWCDVLSD